MQPRTPQRISPTEQAPQMTASAPAAPSAPPPPSETANASMASSEAAPRPRRDRPSFGTPVPKLGLEGRVRPEYVPRWINDSPGRIDRAKVCGYEHILDDDKKPISFVVDKQNGMTAFAMEIPKEFYDEDYIKKQLNEDEKEIAIMRSTIGDAGYRPTIGGTDQPMSQAQVIRGRSPFQ